MAQTRRQGGAWAQQPGSTRFNPPLIVQPPLRPKVFLLSHRLVQTSESYQLRALSRPDFPCPLFHSFTRGCRCCPEAVGAEESLACLLISQEHRWAEGLASQRQPVGRWQTFRRGGSAVILVVSVSRLRYRSCDSDTHRERPATNRRVRVETCHQASSSSPCQSHEWSMPQARVD